MHHLFYECQIVLKDMRVLILLNLFSQASINLLNSMEELSPAERQAVEGATGDLESRYKDLLVAVSDRVKDLDSALVQSQGVQDAVDSVSNWLSQAEVQLK